MGPWHGELAKKDPAYIDVFRRKIAGAVRMANDDMAPVRVKSGTGHAKIGVNRRPMDQDGKVREIGENPKGPIDTDVPILVLEREDGSMLALLLTYACHAIAAGAQPYISADYPGYTQGVMEDKLGCIALFTQGAGADINPIGSRSDRSFELAETHGRKLGRAVLSSVRKMADHETSPCLMVASKKMLIPVREEAFSRSIPRLLRRRKKENAEWIRGRRFPYETYVMRIGSCLLVGLESEPVVEIGLEIKDKVLTKHKEIQQVSVIGYAGNSSYYVSVPKMFEEGGYEYEESLLAKEASSMIINSVTKMVDNVCG